MSTYSIKWCGKNTSISSYKKDNSLIQATGPRKRDIFYKKDSCLVRAMGQRKRDMFYIARMSVSNSSASTNTFNYIVLNASLLWSTACKAESCHANITHTPVLQIMTITHSILCNDFMMTMDG